MDLEYLALMHHVTWDLVSHPIHVDKLMCMWVFTLKHNLNGMVSHHKAQLVATGSSQAYATGYTRIFSLVVFLNFIQVLLSLVVNQTWSLHKLNTSNAFLYVY